MAKKDTAFIKKIQTITIGTGAKAPQPNKKDWKVKEVHLGIAQVTCQECGDSFTSPAMGVEYERRKRPSNPDEQSLSA